MKAAPVICEEFGLLSVTTTVELAPGFIIEDPKDFEMDGGAISDTSSAVELLGLYVIDFVPTDVVLSGSRKVAVAGF